VLSSALLILALSTAAAVADAPEDPGREWCDGPVRYLLTRSEYRRYRRLATAEDRALFVGAFWERLDPDPTTPVNEHRESFEQLCALAEERYEEPLTPGWRADRGRVLILMGVPDSVTRDAGDPSGRDREIWTYHPPPGQRAAPVEFVFHRMPDGRFRLGASEEPEERFNEAEYGWARLQVRREVQQRFYPRNQAVLEVLTDLMMPAPGESPWYEDREILHGSAPPRASFISPAPVARGPGEVEFSDGTYYFRAADGSVLALLALEVGENTLPIEPPSDPEAPDAPGETFGAVAWVTDDWLEAGDPLRPRVSVVRFERGPEPSRQGGAVLAGRTYLEPGSYAVRYAVGGPDRFRVRSRRLDVPDLSADGFSASSVVPADRFGPAHAEVPSPFAVGSEEVVPRPGGVFHKGEPLRLYLQVYGATPDPESGSTTIDVEFRFQRVVRGRTKKHRRPLSIRGASGASMGLALPIGDWRTGDYRVVVDLHDRVADAHATTAGTFRVAE
jgi:GWxTD domain-containing protein